MSWNLQQWKFVLEIKSGRSQKQVKNPEGQYPIYGSGGIMGYADNFICNEGTTIIGRKGTINRPIYVEEKFWNVDTAFGLSPSENIHSKFLYYFCLGYDFSKHDKGTTLPSLVKKDLLANVSMPVPPLEEQKRIVEILDKVFEGIDRAEANTKKNLANARELFDSYLNNIFIEKGDDWEDIKLGEIADFRNGLNFTKGSRGEVVKIVGVKDFQNCFWIREDELESVFESKWNLSDEPTHPPKILFLADRNILANQAFTAFTAFTAFGENALVRIEPQEIKKKGKVPKNGSLFFTIFQTFMTKKGDESTANFYNYSPDFFDFIVVDECHRGGAKDESNWRKILEYFEPAVQLGLTATPKREINGDTYKYFGEPLYKYSLKEGINEGYLTPFKVVQFTTTLDEYQYDPDDDVIEGNIDDEKVYTETDFNRIIEMKEREQQRVEIFMSAINQNEKTLVFCANQDHALAVRDLINQIAISNNPNYCVRVTADEGKIGETQLKTFQDNEKNIPTILTTSRKLSTGVDARNVRNIVLMRPVKSMIEFKQIIGRGTRLFDNKDYFTIYDFVKAHENFNDPEWDGEPQEPVVVDPKPRKKQIEPDTENKVDEIKEVEKNQRIKIKLADGKERELEYAQKITFWDAEGKPISAEEFIKQLFGELPELFQDEAELRSLWSFPDTRRALLNGLTERGYGEEQLKTIAKIINAEQSDIYDVLAYIAYAEKPLTRQERVIKHKDLIFSKYTGKQQEFLDFVLDQYIRDGVGELDRKKLPQLLSLKYHNTNDAIAILGSVQTINEVFTNFQAYLYSDKVIS